MLLLFVEVSTSPSFYFVMGTETMQPGKVMITRIKTIMTKIIPLNVSSLTCSIITRYLKYMCKIAP